MSSSNAKRTRQEFDESINEEPDSPPIKKQRLLNDDAQVDTDQDQAIPKVTDDNSSTKSVEMWQCRVLFEAMQPVINSSGVYKWTAALKHDNNFEVAILAKASFSVISVKQLSKYDPVLSDLIDTDEHFHEVLVVDNIEEMDGFRGFDYDLCLAQRIIDTHTRTYDVVVVKGDDSTQHILKEMNFSQMKQSVY